MQYFGAQKTTIRGSYSAYQIHDLPHIQWLRLLFDLRQILLLQLLGRSQ